MSERLLKTAGQLQAVHKDGPEFIQKDLDPLFQTPGKMLRPAFTILSSTAGEEESPHLYKVAAAVELIHMATLVHDDVIDQAVERRGRPTLNSTLGVKRAVLCGDYLLLKALELASVAHDNRLIDSMNLAARNLCLGEIDQDSGKGEFFISRDTYINRINGKTAELFALACKAGSLLGGASEEVSEKMYQAGRSFGLAFQIEDDILDYLGAAGKMGKAPGKDLKEGIPTLPLILALESGDEKLIRMCRSRFRLKLYRQIRSRVVSSGFAGKASEIAEEYRQKSIGLISGSALRDSRIMQDIIDRLKSRDH